LSDGAALYPIGFVGSEMPSRHDAPAEWPTAVAAQQGKGIGGRVEAGVMSWAGIKPAGIQGRSKGEPGGIWVKWSPDQWTRERERESKGCCLVRGGFMGKQASGLADWVCCGSGPLRRKICFRFLV
jgi:hypothetical protein